MDCGDWGDFRIRVFFVLKHSVEFADRGRDISRRKTQKSQKEDVNILREGGRI